MLRTHTPLIAVGSSKNKPRNMLVEIFASRLLLDVQYQPCFAGLWTGRYDESPRTLDPTGGGSKVSIVGCLSRVRRFTIDIEFSLSSSYSARVIPIDATDVHPRYACWLMKLFLAHNRSAPVVSDATAHVCTRVMSLSDFLTATA